MKRLFKLLALVVALVAFSPRVGAFDYSSVSYQWTDDSGVTHTSKLSDKATDYNQIFALLCEVYTNPAVPGTLNVDGVEGTDVNYTANKPAYITAAKVATPVEGLTCMIVEVKKGAAAERNYPAEAMKQWIKQNVISVQIITDVAESSNTYVLSVSGEYNRFYFMCKGRATNDSSWGYPRGFETLSATGDAQAADGASDFYSRLTAGEVYDVSHDCTDVTGLRHYYTINPGTNSAYLRNITLVMPKNRLKYWDQKTNPGFKWANSQYGYQRSDGGGSRDYVWYNPDYCPKIALYTSTLKAEAKQAADYADEAGKRLFDVKLDWTSSLKDVLKYDGDENYDIYAVEGTDTTRIMSGTALHSQLYSTGGTAYSYQVEQREKTYKLTYVVKCYPSTVDGSVLVGPAVTNVATVIIPGYHEEFLWVSDYRSKFDVATLKNAYKNTIGLTVNRYVFNPAGGEQRVITRTPVGGSEAGKSQDVAKITFGSQDKGASYTIEYYNQDASPRYDNATAAVEGKTDDGITLDDYFTASTAQGGDLAQGYIYAIKGGSNETTVEVPVYASTIQAERATHYSLDEIASDVDMTHRLATNEDVNVAVATDDGVASYDIYKGTSPASSTITFNGTATATDVATPTVQYYTGQLTAQSHAGINTYGTNQVSMASSRVTATLASASKSAYTFHSGSHYYTATLDLKAVQGQASGYSIVGYRVWRNMVDGTPDEQYPDAYITGTQVKIKDRDKNFLFYDDLANSSSVVREVGAQAESATVTKTDGTQETINNFTSGTFGAATSPVVDYVVRLYYTKTAQAAQATARRAAEQAEYYIAEYTLEKDFSNVATAVTTVQAPRQVASVRYYDATGRESATPVQGASIEVTTYTDGSRSTRKVLR